MKTLFKTLLIAVLAICTLEAKSSSGGSSSRSSSSSYSSKPSSSSSSSKPSSPSSKPSSPSSKPSSPSSKPGSSTPQTSTRVTSNVDAARYQSAVKSGKAFTTRESAVANFKTKNANTFTNKFKTEPASRPNYIPSNYTNDGKTYNIVYNQNAGGYGYWNGGGPGLGTWMLYDTLSDMAMMNTMMSRQNYYVGQPIVTYGWMSIMLYVICGIAVISIISWLIFFKFNN